MAAGGKGVLIMTRNMLDGRGSHISPTPILGSWSAPLCSLIGQYVSLHV